MTPVQKSLISSLRSDGTSYNAIASRLGLSVNTVKSFCRNHFVGKTQTVQVKASENICPVCGSALIQSQGHRQKKFCSETCRIKFWQSANGKRKCAYCGKPYNSSHKDSKFCSRACYMKSRFGGAHETE